MPEEVIPEEYLKDGEFCGLSWNEQIVALKRIASLTTQLQQATARAESLEKALDRMKAPVSERVWANALTLAPSIYITDAERATQIINDRAAEAVVARTGAQDVLSRS